MPPSSTVTARNTVTPPRDYCDRANMNAFLYAIGHGYGLYAACKYANVTQEAVLEHIDHGLTSLNTEQAQFVDLFRAAMKHARGRAWASWPLADRQKVTYLKSSIPSGATPADHEKFVTQLARQICLV